MATKSNLLIWLLAIGTLSPVAAEALAEYSQPAHEDLDYAVTAPVIEAVIIEGRPRTRTRLIMRLLGVEAGAPLDERALEEGRDRLMALGIFRSVDLRLERGEAPGRVILVVSLVERGTLLLSDLFLGFTNVTPFYGGFGLTDTNVAGTALTAHGAFVLGAGDRQSFTLSLFDPAFLDRNVFASLSLLHLRGRELHCPLGLGACGEGLAHSSLAYRRTGGRASLGASSGLFSRVGLHYRYEDLSSRVHLGYQGADPAEDSFESAGSLGLPALLLGSSRLSTLGVSFDLDTTDDPFLPRRGIRLNVHTEVGSRLFSSSYEYSRYGAHLDLHWPATRGHSVNLGLFGGFVQGDAPFFDRFHVADHSYFTVGANAVPRALGVSFTEVSQYDDVLVSADLEYRVPLRITNRAVYRAYFHASMALTLSAHTVEGSLLDLSLDPRNEISRFPLSGDLGVRLDTPIGMFSLGLSYPLDLLL